MSINNASIVFRIINWLFGLVFLAIGVINVFWGNDQGFGVFVVLLSLIYFLPVDDLLKKTFGFSIPGMWAVKIVLGLFILWAALGVGELFAKMDLMMRDLRQ